MNFPAAGRRVTDAAQIPIPAWAQTLLVAALIALVTAFVASKEDSRTHEADVSDIRTDIQRVLDVVCLDRTPKPRACE